MKGYIFVCVLSLFSVGCAILEPVKSQKFGDISSYKYAIIGQTQTVNSSSGAGLVGYGMGGGYAYSVSKSVNPADVIAGILIQKGFIVVDMPQDSKALLVKYGQGGKRVVAGGMGGYTLSVSIQMLDSQSNEPLFMCSAEGQGETEADDIRVAITRCLEAL